MGMPPKLVFNGPLQSLKRTTLGRVQIFLDVLTRTVPKRSPIAFKIGKENEQKQLSCK